MVRASACCAWFPLLCLVCCSSSHRCSRISGQTASPYRRRCLAALRIINDNKNALSFLRHLGYGLGFMKRFSFLLITLLLRLFRTPPARSPFSCLCVPRGMHLDSGFAISLPAHNIAATLRCCASFSLTWRIVNKHIKALIRWISFSGSADLSAAPP